MKPDNYCVTCKGTKNMCGLGYCPILKKIHAQHKQSKTLKQDLFGSSNEAFVGSANYPNVSWGPVLSLDENKGMREVYEEGYEKVMEYRSAMVKGRRFGGIRPHKRSVEETQEAALSVRPVDLEVNFSKVPRYDMRFSSVVAPTGASAPMRRVKVCDNPKIPRVVDTLIDEGRRVRKHKQLNRVWVFSHESFSNHYEVMIAPGAWEFENFEAWCPKSIWNLGGSRARVSSEYEPFGGRSKYAASQAGAYYAVRLAVLEFLDQIRRQGRVVAIREVYEGYQVPVGVFQVRENARDAMKNHQMYSGVGEALELISKRLRLPLGEYTKRSKIIGQRNLLEFF